MTISLTSEHIASAIIHEHYFTADQGVDGEYILNNWGDFKAYGFTCPDSHPSLKLTTLCILVLWNGFTVVGKSACADPAKFNAELGKQYAREDAISKVWELLAFITKDPFAGNTSTFPEGNPMNQAQQDQVDQSNETNDMVEVSDLDSFVRILFNWHESKVQVLEHIMDIPDGVVMNYTDDNGKDLQITLTGDLLEAFKMGVNLSLMELGKLPFRIEAQEAFSDAVH